MAEGIAAFISSKLAEALSRTAADGLSSLLGVRSDIATAKADLDLLRAFLCLARAQYGAGTDELAATWVKLAREAALELEDVADECCYLSGQGFARDCVNVVAWLTLSRRLQKARDRLKQVLELKEQYGICKADRFVHHGDAGAVTTSVGIAQKAHFLEDEEIVGFAAHRKLLLGWLAEDAEPGRTLVAVCGMGGVGKTTLATSVYKELRTSHFDCAAWVTVSQRFTREDLLKKILKELRRDVHSGGAAGTDYLSLVAALREYLGRKRYLVVLDDVWDEHLWGELRRALLDDATGSRVVITTRSSVVAKAAAAERTMMVEPLPWREAWTLFCSVAFSSLHSRNCPSHLKELAVNMVERCGGLPLAIVSVWRDVRDSLVWDRSSSDLGIGEASSILNLSIDDLPYQLKKCFLSCSTYPEDFLIKRKLLIKKWIAEGLVEEQGQCTMEEVADSYLDQLVQRNLFQVAESNVFGRAKRCLIHDLIRELITRKYRDDEGFVRLTDSKIAMNSSTRVRHLLLDRWRSHNHNQFGTKMASLRSFYAFASELDASLLSSFRLLTTLNLWCIEVRELPKSVTKLRNLQYLGIRSTLVERLPEDLGNLQKLQILDAKWTMIQRVPSSVAKLRSLRHLVLLKRHAANFSNPSPGTAIGGLPDGLKNLTNLQTLKYVVADKNIVRSLTRLEQMRSLELSGVDASCAVDLSSAISKMSRLVRLGIVSRDADTVLDLESTDQPPRNLVKLALTGKLARGELPSWTCSLHSLKQLHLNACGITQESLLPVASLPSLLHLSLTGAYHDKETTFAGGFFPALETLTLRDLPSLCHIEFQRGCLPELHELVLDRCTQLTGAPQGLENLTHLKNLKLFGMAKEFVEKLEEQNGDMGYHLTADSEFQHVVSSYYLGWVQRTKSLGD